MIFYFWKSQLHVRFKAWKILAFKWYILARKYQLIIWILAQKYQLEMRYFSSNAILNFTGMDCPHFGGISWSWNLLLKLLWDLIFNLQKLYLIDDWSITSTSLATTKDLLFGQPCQLILSENFFSSFCPSYFSKIVFSSIYQCALCPVQSFLSSLIIWVNVCWNLLF